MKKVTRINFKKTALDTAAVVAGVAIGSLLKKTLQKSSTVQGLTGSANDYVVPSVLLAAGAVVAGMADNEAASKFSLGIAAVGGAGIVNAIGGREVVSLGNVGNMGSVRQSTSVVMPRAIPRQLPVRGIGNASTMPGMGNTSTMPGMGIIG